MFILVVSCALLIGVNTSADRSHENQGLTEVPGDIPSDTERLFLLYNNISHVSADDFLGLHRLHYIRLGYNDLTMFPDLPSVGKTLTELYVNNNNISSVPAVHLNILTKLEVLGLSRNDITSLPDAGGTWHPQTTSNLCLLSFRHNNLTTVPVLFDYSDGLEVWAEGNPIVCYQRVAWLLRTPCHLIVYALHPNL